MTTTRTSPHEPYRKIGLFHAKDSRGRMIAVSIYGHFADTTCIGQMTPSEMLTMQELIDELGREVKLESDGVYLAIGRDGETETLTSDERLTGRTTISDKKETFFG